MEASDCGLGTFLLFILIFGPILLHNHQNKKSSADGTAETKIIYGNPIISDGDGKGKKKLRDSGCHEKGGL